MLTLYTDFKAAKRPYIIIGRPDALIYKKEGAPSSIIFSRHKKINPGLFTETITALTGESKSAGFLIIGIIKTITR